MARELKARVKLAQDWVGWLQPSTPYFVDQMTDEARLAYGAWPERLVVVEDGKIKYYGEQGPWGYKPTEVDQWLRTRFPTTASNKL